MNVRTILTQAGHRSSHAASALSVRRAYANLAYNATSQPTSGEVATLDRKLDSLEERIQARREALGNNANTHSEDYVKDTQAQSEASSPLEASKPIKKGIMSILPGRKAVTI